MISSTDQDDSLTELVSNVITSARISDIKSKYNFETMLSTSSSGKSTHTFHKGINKQTNEYVAIQTIDGTKDGTGARGESIPHYQRKIEVLSRLSIKDLTKFNTNPKKQQSNDEKQVNINNNYSNEKGYDKVLHLIDHCHHDKLKSNDDDCNLYITTQLLQGDNLLNAVLEKNSHYKFNDYYNCGKIAKQILFGVKYFHDRNIAHGSIKHPTFRFSKPTPKNTKTQKKDQEDNSKNSNVNRNNNGSDIQNNQISVSTVDNDQQLESDVIATDQENLRKDENKNMGQKSINDGVGIEENDSTNIDTKNDSVNVSGTNNDQSKKEDELNEKEAKENSNGSDGTDNEVLVYDIDDLGDLVLTSYRNCKILDSDTLSHDNNTFRTYFTPYYSAPEVVFEEWYSIWLQQLADEKNEEIKTKDKEKEKNKDKNEDVDTEEKQSTKSENENNNYDKNSNTTDDNTSNSKKQFYAKDFDTQEYQLKFFQQVCEKRKLRSKSTETEEFERLFGYSEEERYKKWKNMDYLPRKKHDNPKYALFERWLHNTPRMFKSSDIWSVGTVIYGLLYGTYPFSCDGKQKTDMFEAIVTQNLEVPSKDARYDTVVPPELKTGAVQTFLLKCLNKDPLKRATVDELLNDPFVNGIPPKKIEAMECLHSCYKIYTTTMLKCAICEALTTIMPEGPLKTVQEQFDMMDKTNKDLDLDVMNEHDIIQHILLCGFDFDYAQNIADNVLCLFGTQIDEYDNGLVLSIEGYKLLWYYTALTKNMNYRNRVFQVFDDDGDGLLSVNDVESILEDHVTIEMDLDEIKWFRTSMFKQHLRARDIECW